jgi:hypothetical protein
MSNTSGDPEKLENSTNLTNKKSNSVYTFEKPIHWNTLPLYTKIQYSYYYLANKYKKYIDKLEAKKIVKCICKDKIKVSNLIRVLDNYDDVKESDINCNYLIKSNFNSRMNINILPDKDYNTFNIRHNLKNFSEIHDKINKDNKKNGITDKKQTFFIEEKIECKYNGKDGNAITFLFRCIHGIPYTFTVMNKNEDQNMHYFIDGNGEVFQINMNYTLTNQVPLTNPIIPDKQNMKKMYELARELSSNFEFVRIDFYLDKEDNVYFSEYTFFPFSGKINFTEEIEVFLGKKWT